MLQMLPFFPSAKTLTAMEPPRHAWEYVGNCVAQQYRLLCGKDRDLMH